MWVLAYTILSWFFFGPRPLNGSCCPRLRGAQLTCLKKPDQFNLTLETHRDVAEQNLILEIFAKAE
jgi:hypothetical protein